MLIGLLGLAACSAPVANRDSMGTNVICFGDSVTQGVGVSPAETYPAILGQMLNRSVINAGVSRNTTRDAVGRLKTDVLDRNPLLVIVEFGANDFLQEISEAETLRNIDQIVEEIEESGAMVVLTEIQVGIIRDRYYKGFKEIAERRKAVFMPDLMSDIMFEPEMKTDSVHPNAKGNRLIAGRIYKVIAPLLNH